MKIFTQVTQDYERLRSMIKCSRDILKDTYDSNTILLLYDYISKLEEAIGEKETFNKNLYFLLGINKKNKYLKRNITNFNNLPVWVDQFADSVKDNVESAIANTSINSNLNNSYVTESDMFTFISDYYRKYFSSEREFIFLTMYDTKIYDSSNFSGNAYNPLYNNKNLIFVKNNNDVNTMANVIYELEHIFNRITLSQYDLKLINKFMYCDNTNEVSALVAKKEFLNYIKEKNPELYNDDVNKVYSADYMYMLDCFNSIQNFNNMKESKIIQNPVFINQLNYFYGHFLSDIYLSLDNTGRRNFKRFFKSRKNGLFDSDILSAMLEITGKDSYSDLSEISEKQYKKYIK